MKASRSVPEPDLLDEELDKGDSAVTGHFAMVTVQDPVERSYCYKIPESMVAAVRIGSLVEVPITGRKTRGCVVALRDRAPDDFPASRIKKIVRVISSGFYIDQELIWLSTWISNYYMCPPGDALGCISFIGFNEIGVQTVRRYTLAAEHENYPGKLGKKQHAVIEFLKQKQMATSSEIASETGAASHVLARLVELRLITELHEEQHRSDDYGTLPMPDFDLQFNPAQAAVFARVQQAIATGKPHTFLLHGVTGSGKTEIYLQAIREAIAQGGQAIVLVPEISLTPQTVERFRRRFGEIVGVYHSRLTLGQKFDLWRAVKSGRVQIMVGARSAVFTPFPDLRVVVVDEEHEQSYKQDSSPRYHARDVAIKRAHDVGAVALLGSATPSIETFYKAKHGKFTLLTLPQRIDTRPLPPIHIIDMTQEVKDNRNPELFSRPLQGALEAALDRREQVLLFLNRRGFFNFMICLSCQKTALCRHCDVSLTLHKPKNNLMCHYCGREYVPPRKCTFCDSNEMSLVGIGTQRVEEYLNQTYPSARVIRMDLDTTRQRNAFLNAWRQIERGEVDIILGTQMIAKGIHLESVTLVGVPLADVSLFQPDFRAAERAFSVLTQVAGRAGRGEKQGQVFIQTYVPHHYAIQFAQSHDYIGFYEKEIRVRQVLRFPPHHRLFAVLATGAKEDETAALVKDFSGYLKNEALRAEESLVVLGPVPAPITRINDQYRWRVLLRGREHRIMKDTLQRAMERFREHPGKSKVQLIVDVDPLDLL